MKDIERERERERKREKEHSMQFVSVIDVLISDQTYKRNTANKAASKSSFFTFSLFFICFSKQATFNQPFNVH